MTSNQWTTAELSEPRQRPAATSLRYLALFAGGFTGGGITCTKNFEPSHFVLLSILHWIRQSGHLQHQQSQMDNCYSQCTSLEYRRCCCRRHGSICRRISQWSVYCFLSGFDFVQNVASTHVARFRTEKPQPILS